MARKKRFNITIDKNIYDTVNRHKREKLIDGSKLIQRLLADYFKSVNYEIRENTPEEDSEK